MTPELVKALTEAGIAMTVVMLSAFVGIKLITALFNYSNAQSRGNNEAWGESVDLLQKAWAENSRIIQDQTAAIRELRNEIKEDRRFWTQQISTSMDRVLSEIKRDAFVGAAQGAQKGIIQTTENINKTTEV